MTIQTDHVKGLAITGLGGMLLTFDIPLLRLGNGESWSVIFLRSTCSIVVMLIVWLALKWFGRKPLPLIQGRTGWIVSVLYALTGLCFLLAVFLTPTANLVFILALNPMIAALLARIFLGERIRRETLIAMVAMAAGVFIIVSGGISAGSLAGNLLALGAAVFLAAALTVSRASGQDMGFSAVMSGAFLAVIAGVVVLFNGYQIEDPVWIILDGAILLPVTMFCLATGTRWLTGPEVAMFYMLETVLAPVWVWLIFREVPGSHTFIGGAIVLGALVIHTAVQIARDRKRRLAARPL
ncbi:DMT family transporter [Zhengella sp. ZM62]|uniref:DMT family transporter n=1 Tax=Zhengella sedimenti TaxID=3390035 RepID=UPI003975C272